MMKIMISRVFGSTFDDAWDEIGATQHIHSLLTFDAGLTRIPSGTHTVEIDVSVLKRVKNK